MELDTFITKTINSIIKGVSGSKDFAHENKAYVNPVMVSSVDSSHTPKLTNIDFDIAVTSSVEKENGINGGISVLNVSLGGKSSDKGIEQSLSRIKFSVSVILPESDFDK